MASPAGSNQPEIIPFDDLDHTRHSHEFVGAEHGDVPFSIILVHSAPGVGPKLHRHPYAEVFVVEIKAAAIDVVAELASERGVGVVFAENEVVPLPGEPDLDDAILQLVPTGART